jgi:uncharacterized membrane protein
MHHLFLILHLIGSMVWVGGHIILATRYLPAAIKNNDVHTISNFEKKFEPIGIPALLIQVITGFTFMYLYKIPMSAIYMPIGSMQILFAIKLYHLIAIIALAIHAKVFIIPKLCTTNLMQLAVHIVLVTLLSISMLIIGSFGRYGGI